MTTDTLEAPAVKTRRPKAVKPSTPQDAGKDKVTVCLSKEANYRLAVHATGMKMDRSALVEKLICDHLRRFVLQDRGERDQQQEDRSSLAVA